MKHLTLWLILTLIGLAVHGQSGSFHSNQIYYQEISIRKGLDTRMVYDIIEDQSGRILLGTDKGLYYFNGSVFSKIACSTAISPEVHNFQMHPNGDIYATNFSGEVFRIRNKSIEELDLHINDFEIGKAHLFGDLLVLSGMGNYLVYDVEKKEKVNSLNLPSNSFRDIDRNTSGEWVCLGFGDTLFTSNFSIPLPCGISHSMITWKEQIYLIPSLTGLDKVMQLQNREVICVGDLKFPSNTKIHGATIFNNALAVYGENGIQVYDDARFGAKEWWCQGMKVSDLIVDQTGNTWISTLGQGLLFAPSQDAYYVDARPMFSVLGQKDDFFAGDANGQVYRYNNYNELVMTYAPQNSLTEATLLKIEGDELFTNTDHFNWRTGRSFEHGYDYIKDVIKTNSGDYYIAKSFGFFFLPGAFAVPSPYGKGFSPEYFELSPHRAYAVMEWGDAVYVASRQGLLKARDKQLSEVECIQGSCRPLGFYRDGNTLLVETVDRGVMKLENDKLVDFINKEQGLSSNIVSKVRKKSNVFYVLTDEGLDAFDLSIGKAMQVTTTASLGALRIRDFDFFENGIVLATDAGLLRIDGATKSPEVPRLLLNGLYIDQVQILVEQEIEVEPGNRSVYLLFESVLYRQTSESVVQYQLLTEGEEGAWQVLPINATRLDLANLRSGHYVVRLRAGDPDRGVFSEIVEVRFHVLAPWYFRWYALLLWSVLVLGGVFLIFNVRSKLVKRRHHREMAKLVLKRELAEAKLVALRAQMNPHFMYNVMNSIQGLIYTGKHEEAGKYMAKFANLTRRFLELSSREKVSIKEESDTLTAYLELEKLRFGDEFIYELKIAESVEVHMDQLPTLLIQPFVENSLKHGLLHQEGEKHLVIRFTRTNDILRVEVEDNGIGRKRAYEINQRRGETSGISYATNAILNKIELLNKNRKHRIAIDILDVNETSGTLVRIDIPDEL